ncbi:DUF433 domain-containing protein [Rhodococcus rhodochrous]|uniref:DUF433 domain-containing protein n=1 Tax=Rhodococcus rhodochrous TaxID=1829 RepID=UPI000382D60D|nr:DUF433 domain-containing protein [Rhodococcus rhodochrous]
MSFPVELTAALTGASVNQLRRWSRDGLIVPEIHEKRPMLYSFRDLVALRSVCFLRSEVSLQKIKRAFQNLPDHELMEHPAEYRFATDGRTVVVWTEDRFMDLVDNPGQFDLVSIDDVYRSFTNRQQRRVVDFKRPRTNLEVNPQRMGGWPTVAGTRVPFDTIANLVADGDISAEEVSEYYPHVHPTAVADAVSFQHEVEGLAS